MAETNPPGLDPTVGEITQRLNKDFHGYACPVCQGTKWQVFGQPKVLPSVAVTARVAGFVCKRCKYVRLHALPPYAAGKLTTDGRQPS